MTNPNAAYVGVVSGNPDAIDDPPKEGTTYGTSDEGGPLLTEADDAKVAKLITKMWTDQDQFQARYLAEVKVNELRRQGHANVEATKVTDRDEYLITVVGAPTTGMNKARTLCRKMVATLFADPPEPDPRPAGADDVHRDQAEFSKKVLDKVTGEGGLDYMTALRRAETDACTYRRSYVCFYVDPAGARIPLQIEAHPQAVSAEAPFAGPPLSDPVSGQPIPSPELPAEEAVLRYVGKDGSLTDNVADAAWTWAPKLKRDLFDGRHVRLLPATAEDLWDAQGVLIASFTPLRDLKRQFPDLFGTKEPAEGPAEGAPDAEPRQPINLEKLKKYPPKANILLPGDTKKERVAAEALKGDDALIFTLRCYLEQGGEYPKGFYGCVLGEEVVAHRGPWAAQMPDGTEEPLDLPLTEVRQWPDECVMDIVGSGNDLRAQQLTALLDHTSQVLNRKTYLPYGSIVGENELLDDSRRILPYNPAGGKPEFEDVAPLDEGVYQMWESLGTEMQEDVGLGATAENLTGGNSGNSGRAKFAIIGQAQVALSEPNQNLGRAYTRGCRIILQLIRAFFTKPQKLDFAQEDGSYRERRWTGADLGSTKDVDLKPGSNSMLSPPQKTEQILSLVQAQVQLDPAEVRDAIIGNIGPVLAMQENPFRQRVLRQIGTWSEGPPKGWAPQPPQPQVVGVDPAGQPMTQLVAPPDPALARIWEPVAADQLPTVAPLRLQELAKAMSGASYQRWPAEWRAGFDAEFTRMQQFAGVMTIPDQQAAAAQQAQLQAAQAGGSGGPPKAPVGRDPEQENRKAQQQGVQDVISAGVQ